MKHSALAKKFGYFGINGSNISCGVTQLFFLAKYCQDGDIPATELELAELAEDTFKLFKFDRGMNRATASMVLFSDALSGPSAPSTIYGIDWGTRLARGLRKRGHEVRRSKTYLNPNSGNDIAVWTWIPSTEFINSLKRKAKVSTGTVAL